MNRNYPDGWGEYEVSRNCLSEGREYGITKFLGYILGCVFGSGMNSQEIRMKRQMGFVMSLMSSVIWSLCFCLMFLLRSPHDIENYESGFHIGSSEANGGVSGRVRMKFASWKDHVSGRKEGRPRTVWQTREVVGGLEKGKWVHRMCRVS